MRLLIILFLLIPAISFSQTTTLYLASRKLWINDGTDSRVAIGYDSFEGWKVNDTAWGITKLWKFYKKRQENWYFWDTKYKWFMERQRPKNKKRFEILFKEYLKSYK